MQNVLDQLLDHLYCGVFILSVQKPDGSLNDAHGDGQLQSSSWHSQPYLDLKFTSVNSVFIEFVLKFYRDWETGINGGRIVTGKQIGRASCRERVCLYV